MQMERLFSVARVADRLDRSENAIRIMIRKGKITAVRVDRRVMVPESELARLLAVQPQRPVLVAANRSA